MDRPYAGFLISMAIFNLCVNYSVYVLNMQFHLTKTSNQKTNKKLKDCTVLAITFCRYILYRTCFLHIFFSNFLGLHLWILKEGKKCKGQGKTNENLKNIKNATIKLETKRLIHSQNLEATNISNNKQDDYARQLHVSLGLPNWSRWKFTINPLFPMHPFSTPWTHQKTVRE